MDDSGTGTPNESVAPLGSSAILENSQCRLHMSGVDRAGIGNLLSVTLTIEFKPSYVGAKGIYMYGRNAAGVYGAAHLAGSYTVVDCAYQVAPGSTTVPSSTGSLTLSVTTQSHCPWTAPGTSSFLNLTTSGSMMGSGQVSYTYGQNTSTSARSTQPVIAGQTITVTQVGNGQPVPGDEVVYYHHDALGSVRAVTDASGVLLRRHDFMPFGQELQATATEDSRLFTGQERGHRDSARLLRRALLPGAGGAIHFCRSWPRQRPPPRPAKLERICLRKKQSAFVRGSRRGKLGIPDEWLGPRSHRRDGASVLYRPRRLQRMTTSGAEPRRNEGGFR